MPRRFYGWLIAQGCSTQLLDDKNDIGIEFVPLNDKLTPLPWNFPASLQDLKVLYNGPLIHPLTIPFTHSPMVAASPIGNILSLSALPKDKLADWDGAQFKLPNFRTLENLLHLLSYFAIRVTSWVVLLPLSEGGHRRRSHWLSQCGLRPSCPPSRPDLLFPGIGSGDPAPPARFAGRSQTSDCPSCWEKSP